LLCGILFTFNRFLHKPYLLTDTCIVLLFISVFLSI